MGMRFRLHRLNPITLTNIYTKNSLKFILDKYILDHSFPPSDISSPVAELWSHLDRINLHLHVETLIVSNACIYVCMYALQC